jgi:transposase
MILNKAVVGIDAHKKSCTTCVFANGVDSHPTHSFVFKTTKRGVSEFMEKVPKDSLIIVEASTTGKTLSRILLQKYVEIHMVAPPERKPSVKTDKRDSERIVREDMLGYLRRCYIPSPYIEDMRFVVGQQMDLGEKISRVKCQVHSLLERNMLQSEFEGFSDIFSVEGLQKLSQIVLSSRQDNLAMAMYLEELALYTKQHAQIETQIARIAESDRDCQILMSHPGINAFTSVAIKSRVGEDANRFPTKKHFCSYAGVVPGANESGERISDHMHVKQGDHVLKYALTCAVTGAVRCKADSAVKRFYLKLIKKKGMTAQKAEVAAARKLACIVWKLLTSKQRYVDENKYLTARKKMMVSSKARREIENAVQPESVPEIIKSLTSKSEMIQSYPENMSKMLGHSRVRSKKRTI